MSASTHEVEQQYLQFAEAAVCYRCTSLVPTPEANLPYTPRCPACNAQGSMLSLQRLVAQLSHSHTYDSDLGAVRVAGGHLILACACGHTRSTSEFAR